jgi:hypothetical protein
MPNLPKQAKRPHFPISRASIMSNNNHGKAAGKLTILFGYFIDIEL